MKVLINIPDDEYKVIRRFGYIAPNKTYPLAMEIINGISIPDNATNGDVMKIIFPKIGIYDEWYNESYQKGGKDAAN